MSGVNYVYVNKYMKSRHFREIYVKGSNGEMDKVIIRVQGYKNKRDRYEVKDAIEFVN